MVQIKTAAGRERFGKLVLTHRMLTHHFPLSYLAALDGMVPATFDGMMPATAVRCDAETRQQDEEDEQHQEHRASPLSNAPSRL